MLYLTEVGCSGELYEVGDDRILRGYSIPIPCGNPRVLVCIFEISKLAR